MVERSLEAAQLWAVGVRYGQEHNLDLTDLLNKIANLDLVYEDMVGCSSTTCQHVPIGGPSHASNPSPRGWRSRPQAGKASPSSSIGRLARGCDPDRERGARDRLGYERDHDQRSHRLLPARPAARPQVLEAQPQQGRLQDLPGRHHDRHQRRRLQPRPDRRRLPRPPVDRPGRPGLLPDRRIRDLHRHQ